MTRLEKIRTMTDEKFIRWCKAVADCPPMTRGICPPSKDEEYHYETCRRCWKHYLSGEFAEVTLA